MGHSFQKDSDMARGYFLDSTCDMGLIINKRQRYATLAFLKINMRHQDPLSRACILYITASNLTLTLITALRTKRDSEIEISITPLNQTRHSLHRRMRLYLNSMRITASASGYSTLSQCVLIPIDYSSMDHMLIFAKLDASTLNHRSAMNRD